jgi:hypothetical protein
MQLYNKNEDGIKAVFDTKDIISQMMEYEINGKIVYLKSTTYREFLDDQKNDIEKLSRMNPTDSLQYLKDKANKYGIEESKARFLYVASEAQIYQTAIKINLVSEKIDDAILSMVGFGELNKDIGFFMLLETYAKDCKKDSSKYVQKTYIIKNKTTSLIKIGKSKNPTQRIKTLSKTSGYELEVIHIFDNDIELLLHKKFAHKRGIGEWFELCDDEINLAITEYSEAS